MSMSILHDIGATLSLLLLVGFGRIDYGTDLGQNGPCRNCNLSSEKEGHAHSYISTNYVERGPLCVYTTF